MRRPAPVAEHRVVDLTIIHQILSIFSSNGKGLKYHQSAYRN